jgi:hypothetical protein
MLTGRNNLTSQAENEYIFLDLFILAVSFFTSLLGVGDLKKSVSYLSFSKYITNT